MLRPKTVEIQEAVLVDLIGVLDDEALGKLTEGSLDALEPYLTEIGQTATAGGRLHHAHQQKRLSAVRTRQKSTIQGPASPASATRSTVDYSPNAGTPADASVGEQRRFTREDLQELLRRVRS